MKILIGSLIFVLGAWAGSGAKYTEIFSGSFRYVAEIPSDWSVDAKGRFAVPRRQPDPKSPMGLSVAFIENSRRGASGYLRDQSELNAVQRKSQGLSGFSASVIRSRGRWSYIETVKRDEQASNLREIIAVLPSEGGFYKASFYARDPWFEPKKVAFDHFLDTFRRQVAPVILTVDRDSGSRFSLQAPAEPWKRAVSSAEDSIRYIGESGPDRLTPPILKVQRFANGKTFRDAEDFLRQQAQTKGNCQAGAVKTLRLASGLVRNVETVCSMDGDDMPEGNGKQNFRSRYFVMPGRVEFAIISLQAPTATYGDYNKTLETMAASFRWRPN